MIACCSYVIPLWHNVYVTHRWSITLLSPPDVFMGSSPGLMWSLSLLRQWEPYWTNSSICAFPLYCSSQNPSLNSHPRQGPEDNNGGDGDGEDSGIGPGGPPPPPGPRHDPNGGRHKLPHHRHYRLIRIKQRVSSVHILPGRIHGSGRSLFVYPKYVPGHLPRTLR